MRYFLTNKTLIVRGAFRACSTGENGGIRNATSLLTLPFTPSSNSLNEQRISNAAYQSGLSPSLTCGLLIPARIVHHATFRFDQVTVFITYGIYPDDIDHSGLSPEYADPTSKIRIICVVNEDLNDRELLTGLVAVTEAETSMMADQIYSGWDCEGVIIGAEKNNLAQRKNNGEWIGKVREAIRYGIEYYREHHPTVADQASPKPSFHIHTTIGGDRWIEWHKGGCSYYPCHFTGQRCDLCYCPLYPCEDKMLGEWTEGSRRKERVWSCAPCTLNHQPAVVHHLRRNPEATSSELKSLLMQNHSF
jgi:adenosylcobinamide hydrolase